MCPASSRAPVVTHNKPCCPVRLPACLPAVSVCLCSCCCVGQQRIMRGCCQPQPRWWAGSQPQQQRSVRPPARAVCCRTVNASAAVPAGQVVSRLGRTAARPPAASAGAAAAAVPAAAAAVAEPSRACTAAGAAVCSRQCTQLGHQGARLLQRVWWESYPLDVHQRLAKRPQGCYWSCCRWCGCAPDGFTDIICSYHNMRDLTWPQEQAGFCVDARS